MMKGYYHSIETFGTVDGPGIRYVLFLSGCKLRCSFCHNPDTWEQGRQEATVDQIIADSERYRNFYDKSGGGITVSGGEPLLQEQFVAELFRNCQGRKIHTLLDTAGYSPLESLKLVLPYTDQIQFSVKAVDPVLHQQLTGTANKEIFANLYYAAAQKIPLTIRYVLIPGINDTMDELRNLADLVNSLSGQVTVELLGYHTMGLEKWQHLGWQYTLGHVHAATEQELGLAMTLLNQYGVETLVC
jgi:pyruvate formate lyase activating enzyme